MGLSHMLRDVTQNDFYSLFRAKINNIRENRELGNMKRCFSTFKMLSYNRKLRYWWRNFMKFTYCIQMIQGNAISLCCDLKEKLSEKNFILPARQPVSTRFDCQWFHWIRDAPSVRHTQETHAVRTAIDQRGEQTIKKIKKLQACKWCLDHAVQLGKRTFLFVDFKLRL